MKQITSYKSILFIVTCFFCLENKTESMISDNSSKQILMKVLLMDLALNDQLVEDLSNILHSGSVKFGTAAECISGNKEGIDKVWNFFEHVSTNEATDLFSKPVLLANNNQEIAVKTTVSRNVPIAVSGTINPVITYARQDIEIFMNIMPSVNDDNSLAMDIDVLCTNIGGEVSLVKHLRSNVNLQDGDIIVLSEPYSDLSSQELLQQRKLFMIARVCFCDAATLA